MEGSESEEEFLSADEGGESENEELVTKQGEILKQPKNKVLKCFDNGDGIITKSKNENIYLELEDEQSINVKNESSILEKNPSSYISVEKSKECSVESFVHENVSNFIETPFSSDNDNNSLIISSCLAIQKLDGSEKEDSEVLINDEKKQPLKKKDFDENEAENLLLENKCMEPSRLNECNGKASENFHPETEESSTEIPLIIEHPKNIEYYHSSCTSNELSLVSENAELLFQTMNPDVFVEKLPDNKPVEQFSQKTIVNKVISEADATNETNEQLLQEVKEDPVALKFHSANESFKHDKSKSTAEAELQLKYESSDDWGWDNWAEDIIQQATNKVSVLVEALEDKLGIPDPIEMAKFVNENFEKDPSIKDEKLLKEYDNPTKEQSPSCESAAHSGFSSWFSSFSPLTSIVQATGQDLVSGGIGALEFIGKKTVDILSDGDPGLRSVRKSFEKPTLSMALRDAKVKFEIDECKKKDRIEESTSTFSDMFDKYQGSAHLDALEMLSNESEKKLQRILAMQSEEVKDESLKLLISIKSKFQLENTDKSMEDIDFKKDVIFFSKKLSLKVTCSKLLNTWQKLKDNKNTCKHIDVVVSTLAELLSRFVEFFRKIADLLILTDVSAKSLAEDRAATFKLLAEVFINEILVFANSYAEEIMENEKESALIFDIYLESSSCATLLQNSYNLLLPILQCSAIK